MGMFPKPKGKLTNPNAKGTTYGGGKDVFRNKNVAGSGKKGMPSDSMKLRHSKKP